MPQEDFIAKLLDMEHLNVLGVENCADMIVLKVEMKRRGAVAKRKLLQPLIFKENSREPIKVRPSRILCKPPTGCRMGAP